MHKADYTFDDGNGTTLQFPIWPHGWAAIKEFYGDPDMNKDLRRDPKWEQKYLKRFTLPFKMVLSYNDEVTVRSVLVNRKCGEAMMTALEIFLKAVTFKAIEHNGWNVLGGIDNFRYQTGSRKYLSVHSLAAAIDHNPHLGEYGKPSHQPQELIDAYDAVGAMWAGRWPEMNSAWPRDAMHIQFATGY